MTRQRWGATLLTFVCWYVLFLVAGPHIHNAWGMVLLMGGYVTGGLLLLNTVDLCCGRWLRRGGQQRALGRYDVHTPAPAPRVMVRRIILEEIVPYEDDRP
jgi:hypothetical protein